MDAPLSTVRIITSRDPSSSSIKVKTMVFRAGRIRQKTDHNAIFYNIDFNSNGHSTYRVHIFPMKYDEMLVYYYNNNQRFLQKNLDQSMIRDLKIFEKLSPLNAQLTIWTANICHGKREVTRKPWLLCHGKGR